MAITKDFTILGQLEYLNVGQKFQHQSCFQANCLGNFLQNREALEDRFQSQYHLGMEATRADVNTN